jgi:hypothetical protein
MALPNPAMSFSPFAILTAEEMNNLVENIESLADGTGFDAGAIDTSDLANGAATADKLDTGAVAAVIATAQSTTSATYTDLATVGPAATVVIGANGLALVTLSADLQNTTLNAFAAMGFAMSGANTLAASNTNALYNKASVAGNSLRMSYTVLLTGLTPGSTTFTAKYQRIVGGTANFSTREISVIPL